MEDIFKFYNRDKNKVKPDNKENYNFSKFSLFNFIEELNFNYYIELNKKIERIENKDENFINSDLNKFENIKKELKYEDIEKFFYDKSFNYGKKEEENDDKLDDSFYTESESCSRNNSIINSKNEIENKILEEENEEDKYKYYNSDDDNIFEFKIKILSDSDYYKGIKFIKDKKILYVGTLFVSKEEIKEEFQGIVVYYDENNELKKFCNGIIYYNNEGKKDEFRGYTINYENNEISNLILNNKFYIIYQEKENDLNKIKIIKKNEKFPEDKSLFEYYYYLENNYLYKENTNEFICYFNKSLFLNSDDSYYIINFTVNKEKFIKNNFILDNETKVKILIDNNYFYEGKIKSIVENENLNEIQLNDENGLFLNRFQKRNNNDFIYKIEGEFENNQFIKGKITKKNYGYNFELFNGEFENNNFKKGNYNFTDKIKYEGEILNNYCHGKGKYINLFDNVKIKTIEGEFYKGKIKVIGTINGEKYNNDELTIIEKIL